MFRSIRAALPLTGLLAICGCAVPSTETPQPATKTPAAVAVPAAPPSMPPPVTQAAEPPVLPDTGAPDGDRDLSRWDGYADMRFGMDEAAFRKTWGSELKGINGEEKACYHLSPQWARVPAEFAFMFGDGKFMRYSTESPILLAPGGGKVGMRAAQIEGLYPGQVQQQPHQYTEGKYLRIIHGANVLIFETDAAGNVTEWRVGVPPFVDYVEGCA